MEILHVLSDHTWFTLIFSERNTCLKPMHISACQITNMQKSSCFSSFYYPFVCVILGLLCWSLLNWSGCEFIDEHIMIGLCEELSTVSWVLMHHCLMLISWANLILFVGVFLFCFVVVVVFNWLQNKCCLWMYFALFLTTVLTSAAINQLQSLPDKKSTKHLTVESVPTLLKMHHPAFWLLLLKCTPERNTFKKDTRWDQSLIWDSMLSNI